MDVITHHVVIKNKSSGYKGVHINNMLSAFSIIQHIKGVRGKRYYRNGVHLTLEFVVFHDVDIVEVNFYTPLKESESWLKTQLNVQPAYD